MTENEYNETFDLQMEKEHQETVRRMQEFRLIGEQISKMPDTPPKVLEIEVRYLMGIIKELEARIKDLESEVRHLELLVTRANWTENTIWRNPRTRRSNTTNRDKHQRHIQRMRTISSHKRRTNARTLHKWRHLELARDT